MNKINFVYYYKGLKYGFNTIAVLSTVIDGKHPALFEYGCSYINEIELKLHAKTKIGAVIKCIKRGGLL
jgi:hypothetical protein